MNFVEIVIIASLIVIMGKTIKGLTGFASSPIIVPLLTLFLDLKFVVPVVATITFFSGLIMFILTRKHIKKDEFLLVLIFVIIGSFIGSQILAYFDSNILKKILGVTIILYALKMLLSQNISLNKNLKKFWGALAGFIGGIFGGLFDVNGPPIVIYMSHKLSKKPFRATITAIFFVDVIWRNILYTLNGVATLESLKFALYLLPALTIGILLGSKLQVNINEALFKRIVAIILLITGILLIF